jgi:hypothetical protein
MTYAGPPLLLLFYLLTSCNTNDPQHILWKMIKGKKIDGTGFEFRALYLLSRHSVT